MHQQLNTDQSKVTLENKDIGFVFAGQRAAIKLETFPYTKYCTVPASDVMKDNKEIYGALKRKK